jgi:ATP-dependent helicase/nuclease subunit A
MSCIEGMGLSGPQSAAVLDTRPRVLVAAGAGSGKTRLLIARVLHALIEESLPVERLIAVTFTRKAATELVTRLRASLEECGRPNLARSLDLATTGTIHSLCRRLVKDHALESGVDPACVVLEADAADLLKQEAGRRAWESYVERAGEAELEVLALEGEGLRREMISLYDRLRGLGYDPPRLSIHAEVSEEQARSDLACSAGAALLEGSALPKRSKTVDGDLSTLVDCLAWLEQGPTGGASWDVASAVDSGLRASARFFPSRRTPAMEPHFVPVREALTRYRRALAKTRLEPLVTTINGLLAEFHLLYSARKQEQGLVDFTDLELLARDLVTRSGEGGPSAAALPGTLLLVDEFQDTNELQCSILEGLVADRMLMVGDERQSIYRFRGADVDVFRRRQAELEAFGERGAAGVGVAAGAGAARATGPVHRLDINYRSRPEVLAFINRLFAHPAFFGARFVPLQPDPAWTAAVRGVGGPSVEVIVANRGPQTEDQERAVPMQEAEAEAVAGGVRELVDEQGWQQRDIVVLLPAQTHVGRYQEALHAQGVDVYVVRGKGYYSQDEVSDVVSLLRLLVNPRDDLALVSVLRSPMVGLSDDGLYILGKAGRAMRADSLWTAIQAGAPEPLGLDDRALLEEFTGRLGGIRRRVGRPGLARLVDEAVSACAYDLCLLASAGGGRRYANVRKLMRLAAEFEAVNGPDLAGFVDSLRSRDDLGDREGNAPTLTEGENVVRVMTVHQAKGLEFPVVVLAGLGSDVPHGSSPAFVIGGDGRMGVFLKGSQHKTYEEADLCWGPADEIAAQERIRDEEEDVRLLYVAMTRAQERLILVGAGPKNGQATSGRIARITGALGLAAMPAPREVVSMEGLDAVVKGVDPAAMAHLPGREQDADSEAASPPAFEAEPGPCPQFIETLPRCGLYRQVSFSALAAYLRCPQQFYLEHLLGLTLTEEGLAREEDDAGSWPHSLLDPEEQHAGRDVGLLVHALLEWAPATGEPPATAALLDEAQGWQRQTGVHLSREALERATELTRAFWSSPLAAGLSAPSARREAPFFFAQAETVVSGIMDIVFIDDGCWHIVDYKTNALSGRSPSELATDYRLQGVVYRLAALRAGAPAVQMDFVFLERPGDPVMVRSGPEDMASLAEELDEALAGLRQGHFPAIGGENCGRCSVASLCGGMACP